MRGHELSPRDNLMIPDVSGRVLLYCFTVQPPTRRMEALGPLLPGEDRQNSLTARQWHMLLPKGNTTQPWWRHQMETFSTILDFMRGIHRSPVNSPHKGQWSEALMFSLICSLNKRLSKQSWCWWFETLSRSLWHHCNDNNLIVATSFRRHNDVVIASCVRWVVTIAYYAYGISNNLGSRFACCCGPCCGEVDLSIEFTGAIKTLRFPKSPRSKPKNYGYMRRMNPHRSFTCLM